MYLPDMAEVFHLLSQSFWRPQRDWQPGPIRPRGGWIRSIWGSLSVLLLCCGMAGPLRAETRVELGDVLRVSVLEEPAIGREAKVDADGRIVLPRLGGLAVAGRDLDQIRALIETTLIERGLIRQPTVLVEIAAYRPVFVGGAVVRPGAIPFEPGLTVRHALILAGGLDRSAEGVILTSVELAALKTELQAKAYHLVQIDSLILRLRAELERSPAPKREDLASRFVPEARAEGIFSLDLRLLENRVSEWQANRTHMQEAVTLVDVEIDVLKQQIDLLKQEAAIQQAELETSRELFRQNLIPRPRLQEMERETSALSRDLLDAQAFLARANQTRSDKEYELDSADTLWRIDIQRDLRTAMLEQSRLTADVDILRDKMLAAGLLMGEDGTLRPPVPEVVVHRLSEGKSTTLKAGPDSEIRAGDVLEVTIAPMSEG